MPHASRYRRLQKYVAHDERFTERKIHMSPRVASRECQSRSRLLVLPRAKTATGEGGEYVL